MGDTPMMGIMLTLGHGTWYDDAVINMTRLMSSNAHEPGHQYEGSHTRRGGCNQPGTSSDDTLMTCRAGSARTGVFLM